MPTALQPEIEVIVCPLCGTRDHERPFLEDGRPTRFVRCGQCRSVYLNPRPVAAQRSDLAARDAGKVIQNHLRVAESRKRAFQIVSQALHRYAQTGASLDIGCNTGALFSHFDRRAWRRYGVEPDHDLAAYASAATGATVHAGTLDDFDFPLDRFDVVTMIDTLYILPDPLTALAGIRQILKPAGVLGIEFPGQAYILGRSVGPVNYLLEGRWSRLRTDGGHLYFFTPAGMEELLARTGFAVREWITIPSPSGPGLRGLPAWLHYTMCRLAAPLSGRLLNYFPKILCIASPAREL